MTDFIEIPVDLTFYLKTKQDPVIISGAKMGFTPDSLPPDADTLSEMVKMIIMGWTDSKTEPWLEFKDGSPNIKLIKADEVLAVYIMPPFDYKPENYGGNINYN